eukprot:5371731-Pleurochrysis_carterae.AAC.1
MESERGEDGGRERTGGRRWGCMRLPGAREEGPFMARKAWSACAVLATAPHPVEIPQPSRQILSSGAVFGTCDEMRMHEHSVSDGARVMARAREESPRSNLE